MRKFGKKYVEASKKSRKKIKTMKLVKQLS